MHISNFKIDLQSFFWIGEFQIIFSKQIMVIQGKICYLSYLYDSINSFGKVLFEISALNFHWNSGWFSELKLWWKKALSCRVTNRPSFVLAHHRKWRYQLKVFSHHQNVECFALCQSDNAFDVWFFFHWLRASLDQSLSFKVQSEYNSKFKLQHHFKSFEAVLIWS